MRCGVTQFLIGIALAALSPSPRAAHAASIPDHYIEPDKQIVFYPTFGHLDDTATTWTVELHACVFETDPDSKWRKAAVHEIAEATDLDLDATQSLTFDRRLRLFMVDHVRRQQIRIKLAGRDLLMPPTAANGHASLTAHIPASALHSIPHIRAAALHSNANTSRPAWISFHAFLPGDELYPMSGIIQLIPPTGLSVISDIDDTIKDTGVLDRRRMLGNTFWQPAKPIAGMADLYFYWADSGAAFHYVSASPWQLYQPLTEFISASGFPEGSLQMRLFRLTDRSMVKFISGGVVAYKTEQIERLIQSFPRRAFILVGDSGEHDPEIYGAIARKYPNQIALICIRRVAGSDLSADRFGKAFAEIQPKITRLYDDPAALRDSLLKSALP